MLCTASRRKPFADLFVCNIRCSSLHPPLDSLQHVTSQSTPFFRQIPDPSIHAVFSLIQSYLSFYFPFLFSDRSEFFLINPFSSKCATAYPIFYPPLPSRPSRCQFRYESFGLRHLAVFNSCTKGSRKVSVTRSRHLRHFTAPGYGMCKPRIRNILSQGSSGIIVTVVWPPGLSKLECDEGTGEYDSEIGKSTNSEKWKDGKRKYRG